MLAVKNMLLSCAIYTGVNIFTRKSTRRRIARCVQWDLMALLLYARLVISIKLLAIYNLITVASTPESIYSHSRIRVCNWISPPWMSAVVSSRPMKTDYVNYRPPYIFLLKSLCFCNWNYAASVPSISRARPNQCFSRLAIFWVVLHIWFSNIKLLRYHTERFF